MLQNLCETGTCRDHQTRRHRHHGQSGKSQGKDHSPNDTKRWRTPVVSAALLPRPQPNRANLCQNKTLDAHGPETNNRGGMEICTPCQASSRRYLRQIAFFYAGNIFLKNSAIVMTHENISANFTIRLEKHEDSEEIDALAALV